MGETLRPVAAGFNRSLTIETRSERLTGDPGAVLLREVLDATRIIPWMAAQMKDERRQADVVHDLPSLLRAMVLLVAQGWQDHGDADALRHDPAMCLAASSSAGLTPLTQAPGLPSQPTLSRCAAMLARPENLKVLREAALELAGRNLRAENGGERHTRVTLDVDSLPVEVHGHQPKAAWNGHYAARIYHPLITSIAETGDMLDARLRPGNVGTANGALDVILDVVDRAEASLCKITHVRIDAGFPSGQLLAGLDDRGVHFVARLRANAALDRLAAPYMKRPPGRPPAEPRMWTHELEHQASSWDAPRRVVLVVKERPDDLLLDRFFLVTSISRFQMNGETLLEYYRRRGKAEGHMGELMDVLDPALSSTNRTKSHVRGKTPRTAAPAIDAFACNEVRLLTAMLAYQVMHVARRAMARATGSPWSLRRLRERVLRGGARLVISARRATLILARAVAPFWAAIWPQIQMVRGASP
ncbi:IS1380 family transposase [Roseovarius salinarum]|uniref:IS1380 family transposase n=1 Tax=Roseovarius salinarum TaxID=1981892 RepID=UPI000C32B381|nr:IS1380 family transposase [Roseovarius salinarum]